MYFLVTKPSASRVNQFVAQHEAPTANMVHGENGANANVANVVFVCAVANRLLSAEVQKENHVADQTFKRKYATTKAVPIVQTLVETFT